MFCAAVRGLTALTLTTALLVAIVATPALAQNDEPAQLAISPLDQDGSWFDLELDPGEQAELAVGLANHGSAPVQARTYAADVYSLINGGMGVRLHDEPVDNAATGWIDYPAGNPTLQPDRELRRSFTVVVPDDATPGEYIAALVLQHQGASADGDSNVGIDQVTRQAIAVSITIPGPAAPDLTIDESTHHRSAAGSTIRTEITNPGNQHLAPAGTTTVTGPDGNVVATRDQDLAIVYAGSTTHVETAFDHHLDPGTYTIATTLADDTHDVEATHTSTLDITAPPADSQPSESSPIPGVDQITRTLDQAGNPTLIAALVGVIALLLGALLAVLLTRRHPRHTRESHTPAPDTGPLPQSVPTPTPQPQPTASVAPGADPTGSPGSTRRAEPAPTGPSLFTAHNTPAQDRHT